MRRCRPPGRTPGARRRSACICRESTGRPDRASPTWQRSLPDFALALACSHACSSVVSVLLRASLAAVSLNPAIAFAMVSVTFSLATSTSASCAGQRNSRLRSAAAKPSSTRLLSLDDSSARQDSTQWWLVSIRPAGETNDAVQLVSRIVDSRTWSSQAGVISTPYCRCTAVEGKLSNVHIPSSAYAGKPPSTPRCQHESYRMRAS